MSSLGKGAMPLAACVQVCDFSLSVSTLAGLPLPLCHRVKRLYLGDVTA